MSSVGLCEVRRVVFTKHNITTLDAWTHLNRTQQLHTAFDELSWIIGSVEFMFSISTSELGEECWSGNSKFTDDGSGTFSCINTPVLPPTIQTRHQCYSNNNN